MTGVGRLLWIVNHRSMQAEVPILQDLGHEVFLPKGESPGWDDPEYRSGVGHARIRRVVELAARGAEGAEHPRLLSPRLEPHRDRHPRQVLRRPRHIGLRLSHAPQRGQPKVPWDRRRPRVRLRGSTVLLGTPRGLGPRCCSEQIGAMGRRFVFGQGYPEPGRDRGAGAPRPRGDDHRSAAGPRVRARGSMDRTGHARHPSVPRDPQERVLPDGLRGDQTRLRRPSPPRLRAADRAHRRPRGLPVSLRLGRAARSASTAVRLCSSIRRTEPRHVHYSPLEAMVVVSLCPSTVAAP